MYAPERHQAILDATREAGRVEVNALADRLDVTPETIRRDLTSLERRGLVRRAHGGAIPVERTLVGPAVADRNEVLIAEKLSPATVRRSGPTSRCATATAPTGTSCCPTSPTSTPS